MAGVIAVSAGHGVALLFLAAAAGGGLALFWTAMPETEPGRRAAIAPAGHGAAAPAAAPWRPHSGGGPPVIGGRPAITSPRRLQPEDAAVDLVGQHVDHPVGALAHVAHPLADPDRLVLRDLAVGAERDAADVLRGEAAR